MRALNKSTIDWPRNLSKWHYKTLLASYTKQVQTNNKTTDRKTIFMSSFTPTPRYSRNTFIYVYSVAMCLCAQTVMVSTAYEMYKYRIAFFMADNKTNQYHFRRVKCDFHWFSWQFFFLEQFFFDETFCGASFFQQFSENRFLFLSFYWKLSLFLLKNENKNKMHFVIGMECKINGTTNPIVCKQRERWG